jgi:hypothetical protein
MPAEPSTGLTNYDSPWKDAIQLNLRDFLALCFPHVEREVDWAREPEFLEQELREVVRDSEVGPQRVDQLIRVWRLEGGELWVLLHVEVQAQVDRGLAERLFQYFTRLTQQFGSRVVSLCVLADRSPAFRPSTYEWGFWGCQVRFDFPACKLLDFGERQLEDSTNPIAVVIRAHRVAQRTPKGSAERAGAKWQLVRGLFERGLTKEQIWQLFRLIDWLIALPKPAELDFRRQLHEYQESKRMPYITSIERLAREEGLELGLEQGREQGLEQGQEKVRQALCDTILTNVGRHYGSVPADLEARLLRIQDEDLLRRVFDLTWDAPSLPEFLRQLEEMAAA